MGPGTLAILFSLICVFGAIRMITTPRVWVWTSVYAIAFWVALLFFITWATGPKGA